MRSAVTIEVGNDESKPAVVVPLGEQAVDWHRGATVVNLKVLGGAARRLARCTGLAATSQSRVHSPFASRLTLMRSP